jgi:prepilin-type N-terminal cleavage/methylation domain-containing protein
MLRRILPSATNVAMETYLSGISSFRKLLLATGGFTLVEVAVSLTILSMGVGLVGTGVFQVLSIQRFWQDDQIATKENRHAGSWFAGDALKTTATDLAPGGALVTQVTLTTDDGDITYSQSGDTLLRQKGSDQIVIARDVVSVGFALSTNGKVLTFTSEALAANGNTETLSLQNYLRLAQ